MWRQSCCRSPPRQSVRKEIAPSSIKRKGGQSMKLKHKIRINIADKSGDKQKVLQSEHRSIPKRLLTFLFGEFCEVLVLTPGETVQGIEIKEMRGDGND